MLQRVTVFLQPYVLHAKRHNGRLNIALTYFQPEETLVLYIESPEERTLRFGFTSRIGLHAIL